MGFDNECIPNIQSLAGEYFCPVCRQLVYPNEAIQTQCTHLYCKPCLTYIVSTTRACPYDGYLVTEADSKPLIESNKSVADAIGLIPVQCLYHRSGCTWQGSLTECILHCTSCAYGNSPVVCNRCGTQIVHRQVQEHAQNCPGTQPLQQQDGNQVQTTSGSTLEQSQSTASIPAGDAAATQAVQDQNQGTTNAPTQSIPTAQTPEQWYQQYQQYYQQYPQYQQYYQQYGQYQQHMQQYQSMQAYPQGAQQMVMPQTSAQPYPQPPPQSQTLPQSQPSHAHPQPPVQPQSSTYVPSHPPTQPQMQPQASQQSHVPSFPPLTQGQPPAQPQPQPQVQPQSQTQPQHQPQSHPQPQQQQHPQGQPHLLPQPQVVPQQQAPVVPQQQAQVAPQQQAQLHLHPHPLQPHSYTQPQAQTYQHPYPQPQPFAHAQQPLPSAPHSQQHIPHPQPQNQQAHINPNQPQMQNLPAVTGHLLYPQTSLGMPGHAPQSQHLQPVISVHQQQQNAPVQQHPAQLHPQQQSLNQPVPQQLQVPNQFPPQQLRPPHPPLQSHTPVQHQQHLPTVPPQSQHPRGPPPQLPQMGPRPQGQPIQGHSYPGTHPPSHQQIAPQQPVAQYPHHQQAQLHQAQPYSGLPSNSGHHQQQPPLYPQPGQQPLQTMHTARPQGPHSVAQLASHQNIPPQHLPVGPQSFGPQHHATRPIQNHGVQHQQPPVRPMHQGVNQQSPILHTPRTNPPTVPQQQSPSLQKHPSSHHISLTSAMTSQPGDNFNQALGIGTLAQASSENKQVSLQDQIAEASIPSLKSESLPKGGESDDANPKNADLESVSNGVMSFNGKEEEVIGNREEMLTKTKLDLSEDPDPSNVQKGELLHEQGLLYPLQTVSAKDNASENVLEMPDGKINNTSVDAQEEQEKKRNPQDKEDSDQPVASQSKDNDLLCEKKDTGALQKSQLGQVSDRLGNSVSASDRGPQSNKQMLDPLLSETSVGLEMSGGDRNASSTSKGLEISNLQTPRQHLVGGPMLPQHHQMPAPVNEQFSQLGPSERNFPRDSQPGFVPHATRPVGHSNRTEHSQMQANTFMHPAPPVPFRNEKDPHSFPTHHGPPCGQESFMQRPPLHSVPPHMPNLGGRFQEPPHAIPVQGQIPPNRGPQGPNTQFGPSTLPHGPLNAELNSVPGAPQPSFGSGQFMGPPQKSFDLPPRSYGQAPAHSHAFPPGDAFTRPPIDVPRPGPFDSPGSVFPHGSGPPFVRPPPMIVEQPDGLHNRRPFESWQPDTRPSLSSDHPPPGPSSWVLPGNRNVHEGLHESVLPQPQQDGRSRPLPGERMNPSKDEVFKPLPDDSFKPFPLDTAKRVVDRKEFEEDLKKFPRPRHLEGEKGFQYDGSSARPGAVHSHSNFDPFRNVEGPSHAFDRDSVFNSDGTSLPPRSFGSFPSSDIRERFRPSSVHGDSFDRKFDQALPRPNFLGPVQESGHLGANNLPPPRSPGRDHDGLSGRFMGGSPHVGSASLSRTESFGVKEGRFGDRSGSYSHSSDDKPSSFHNRTQVGAPEDRFSSFQPSALGPSSIFEPFGPGSLPNHLRRGDVSGHMRNGDVLGLSSHARFGESTGPFKLPSYLPPHLNVGEPLGHGALQMGEPGFPVHHEGNYFDPLPRQHDMEFFDHPIKRKLGNMAWCRICQIDCETVEGLDCHTQTREHQKKAMDMVIRIKKDSAKKQKRSSEDNAPLDDVMKTKNKQ